MQDRISGERFQDQFSSGVQYSMLQYDEVFNIKAMSWLPSCLFCCIKKPHYNTVSLITGSASMDPNSIIMRLTCTGFLS